MARCKAKTKKGPRCKARPLKGRDVCLAHSDEKTRTSTNFQRGPRPGRPRSPRVVDVVRERIEAEIDDWYQVLAEARTATRAVVVGQGEYATVEYVPDHMARLRAFSEAMDRAYGRPKQALEHTGAGGGPMQITEEAFADPKTRKAADALVRRVGAARSEQMAADGDEAR